MQPKEVFEVWFIIGAPPKRAVRPVLESIRGKSVIYLARVSEGAGFLR